jgi:putative transcriptional regulator
MEKNLFGKLVESMREMNDVAAGKRKPSRTFQVDVSGVKKLTDPVYHMVVMSRRRR